MNMTDSDTFRRRPQRASVAAIVIAAILGGLFAVGVVYLIPDSWKGQSSAKQDREGDETSPSKTTGNPPRNSEEKSRQVALPSWKTSDVGTSFGKSSPPDEAAKRGRKLEADAAHRLADARRLIEAGKKNEAESVLEEVLTRYSGTKAAIEAQELLLKLAP